LQRPGEAVVDGGEEEGVLAVQAERLLPVSLPCEVPDTAHGARRQHAAAVNHAIVSQRRRVRRAVFGSVEHDQPRRAVIGRGERLGQQRVACGILDSADVGMGDQIEQVVEVKGDAGVDRDVVVDAGNRAGIGDAAHVGQGAGNGLARRSRDHDPARAHRRVAPRALDHALAAQVGHGDE